MFCEDVSHSPITKKFCSTKLIGSLLSTSFFWWSRLVFCPIFDLVFTSVTLTGLENQRTFSVLHIASIWCRYNNSIMTEHQRGQLPKNHELQNTNMETWMKTRGCWKHEYLCNSWYICCNLIGSIHSVGSNWRLGVFVVINGGEISQFYDQIDAIQILVLD